MKKYKLIKEYPGCQLKVGDEVITHSATNNLYNNSCHSFDKEDVEDFPEFWQEVVEKDYEVTTLGFNFSKTWGDKAYLQGNGRYAKYPYMHFDNTYLAGSTLEDCLKSNWYIYSVKRLSDGEVFTVGDVCTPVRINNPAKITKFEFIPGDQLRIQGEKDGLRYWYLDMSSIVKIKVPIFTTEDGVGYYDDKDLVWDTHSYDSNSTAIFTNPDFLCQTEVKWAKTLNRKFFSTREAALSYKEDNGPQYSKKDMLEFSKKVTEECYFQIPYILTDVEINNCFNRWKNQKKSI